MKGSAWYVRSRRGCTYPGRDVVLFAPRDITQMGSACWKRYSLEGRFGIACEWVAA